NHVSLMVRRTGEAPRDLAWLGWSVAQDISPDKKSVLFMDFGATTAGAWVRPIDGGDAGRLRGAEPFRLSPDGKWVVALTRPAGGPRQLVLMPVAAGQPRVLGASAASRAWPTFLGSDGLLFVRADKEGERVATIRTDGTGERALDATDCMRPEP